MNKDDFRNALLEADAVRHARHVNCAGWAFGLTAAVVGLVAFVMAYDLMNPMP